MGLLTLAFAASHGSSVLGIAAELTWPDSPASPHGQCTQQQLLNSAQSPEGMICPPHFSQFVILKELSFDNSPISPRQPSLLEREGLGTYGLAPMVGGLPPILSFDSSPLPS